MFKDITKWGYRKLSVYVLTNFNTTFEQDLERVYTLRDMGYDPYIMVYDKAHTTGRDNVRRLQRWVNNRIIFRTVSTFEESAICCVNRQKKAYSMQWYMFEGRCVYVLRKLL